MVKKHIIHSLEREEKLWAEWKKKKHEGEELLRKWRIACRELRDIHRALFNITKLTFGEFSQKETDVLNLLKLDPHMSNKEIAANLDISLRATKHRLATLMKKAGVSNRHDLTRQN